MAKHNRTRALCHTTLPLDTVRIGRWVPNISYPHHGYLDPFSNLSPLVHETLQGSFQQIYKDEDGAGTNLRGTVLASGFAKKRDQSRTNIATTLSNIFQLDNPEALYSDAIQHPDNRKWIERALKEYGEIFMIIGYQTIDNAQIREDCQSDKKSTIDLQAPISAALAATTSVPFLGNGLDPSIGRESHKTIQIQRSFNSLGVQVVAVQYRRIRFRFFNSKELGMKNLETKTRWQYVWDMRGQTTNASDVVEASLAYSDWEGDEDQSDDSDASS